MKTTAREIAFRNFYELLKTPSYAVLGYYKNLLRAFRSLFADNPEVIRQMRRKVREAELMVGVVRTPENLSKYREYMKLKQMESELEQELEFLSNYLPIENQWMNRMLGTIYNRNIEKLRELRYKLFRLIMSIKPLMSLSTMERYMENNQNLKSFFKEGGKKITQFQIEAKLEEVIDWMNDLASDEMKYIRFTKQTIG